VADKCEMKTKLVTVYHNERVLWTHETADDEFVRVGYQPWGVVVDIAKSKEDLNLCGHGVTRKIFHGCAVVEDLVRT